MSDLLIIGAGTERCGDDAAGLAVARALKSAQLPDFVRLLECTGDGTTLLNALEGVERAILIDAVSAHAPVGTIYTVDLVREVLPSRWRPSTHSIGVSEALRLARTLGSLPSTCILYGIQGGDFRPGHGLSHEVRQAVEKVTAMIELELIAEMYRP